MPFESAETSQPGVAQLVARVVLGVPCLYPGRDRPKRRKALQRLRLRDLNSRAKQAENRQ